MIDNYTKKITETLSKYDEAFDYYLENHQLPNSFPSDDMLAEFIKRAIDGNPQIKCDNTLWRDILKDDVLSFIMAMLKFFVPFEKTYRKEKELIKIFADGNIEKKRSLWPEVYKTIKERYGPDEVYVDGYVQQFSTNDAEYVFGPLVEDWSMACDLRYKNTKTKYVLSSQEDWERKISSSCNKDYKDRLKWDKLYASHPELIEIVQIIGREKPSRNEEVDKTISKYIPIMPSPPMPAVEIEEITNGNDLQHLLPIETAILADNQSENLFYYKFAMNQLQLFANKPKLNGVMKTEQVKKKDPRLEKGPIIICLDTSGSMEGNPIKLATCLVMQLLQLAKKQKRHCFLISFSVRAQSIDLSLPGKIKEIEKFLSDSYSGGTDGNEMLKAGLEALETDYYAMADMLIISDFIFPPPKLQVLQAMSDERKKGTRFYGLQIGSFLSDYERLLDKIWLIKC